MCPPTFSTGLAAAAPTDPGALTVWPYGPVADHRDELGPLSTDRALLYDGDDPRRGGRLAGRLGVLGSGCR